jgi:hypothetical protein
MAWWKRGCWVALACLAGCAQYSDVPYTEAGLHRQVIDKETGKGIPDVLVAFKWTRNEGFSPGGSNTACDHIAMLHTDGEGRYTIASYRGRMGGVVAIYKPGYSEINDPVARREGRDYLKPFRGTVQERQSEFERIYNPVGCTEDEDKKLVELYQRMYEEAKAIASPEKDTKFIDGALVIYEYAALGREEAQKRSLARRLMRLREGTNK